MSSFKNDKQRKAVMSKLNQKQWKMYHGTSEKYAQQIEKEGLKPENYRWNKIFLTPNERLAEQYAKHGAKYPGEDKPSTWKNREGAVFEVTLNEEDFKQSGDQKINEIRKKNLERAIDEDWHEYEYYYPIDKKNIKRIK